jgi:RNA polymerase sigma factor (sigma-70 family)
MQNLTDIEIINFFSSKRNQALEEIYNRYSALVYGVCLKYLGNRDESLDTVVEVFSLLTEKVPHHEIFNFSSWLYSVTKNHCLMKLRTDKRHNEAMKNYVNEVEHISPESSDEELVPGKNLEKAICQLSSEQKVCVELFYYQNKSYIEISDITGFTVKSVKSYLQNGKIKLKKIMEEYQ